jgi:AAHS family 4-hydroxybenzoate transporter-like MFS transporter
MATPDVVEKSTDRREISKTPFVLIAVLFIAMMIDGFDTTALGFVVPSLADRWAVSPASFTFALVAANIAVVVGYTTAGWFAHRLGRRVVLIASILVIAVGSALTALVLPAESVGLLTAVRFVTGLGLGAILPSAVSLAASVSPSRRREAVSIAVTMGLGAGAAVGGVLGSRLIASAGPAAVFWVGAVAPVLIAAILLPILWNVRAADRGAELTAVGGKSKVASLFREGRASSTVLLWAFAFLVFLANYTLISWVPTLLVSYGFDPAQAAVGSSASGIGGLIGALILIPLAARFGTARILIGLTALAAVFLVLAATLVVPPSTLLILIAVVGAGLAGMVGQASMAVALYPDGLRTTGVGWAAALGRIGSIVGPAVGGLLLALALGAREILALTAIPVAHAAVIVAAIAWRARSAKASDSA